VEGEVDEGCWGLEVTEGGCDEVGAPPGEAHQLFDPASVAVEQRLQTGRDDRQRMIRRVEQRYVAEGAFVGDGERVGDLPGAEVDPAGRLEMHVGWGVRHRHRHDEALALMRLVEGDAKRPPS